MKKLKKKKITNLLKKIKLTIDKLKSDFKAGKHIPKKRIPKEYKKLGVENLWKIKIDENWRLIYTVSGDSEGITSILIEFISHKDYERKFEYKRS